MTFRNNLQYVTFADRTQVENLIDEYDELTIQSHLLAGGKKAVTALVWNLSKENDLEFYVDPTSTQFRRGRNFRKPDGSLGAWHEKLVQELGEPFTRLESEIENLDYSQLSDDDLEQAAKAVVQFQENFISDAVSENVGKYEHVNVQNLQPQAVVPIYSQIEEVEDIQLNREIVEYSLDESSLPIKPCLHVSKNFIRDTTNRSLLADFCSEFELSEVFVWVNALDKSGSSRREHIATIDTVAEIQLAGTDPYFLFGNYFANLLYFFGLRGISFGTYYRESSEEKFTSGSGGGSLQRFYFDPVKEFLSIPDAIELAVELDAELPAHGMLNDWSDLYRRGNDHDFLKNHFVRTKRHHKNLVQTSGLNNLIEDLRHSYNHFGPNLDSQENTKSAEHLRIWADAIEDYQEDYPEKSEELISEAIRLQTV